MQNIVIATVEFSPDNTEQKFADLSGNQIPISDKFQAFNSWFATTWQGDHIGGQYNRIFSRRIYMKIEFRSQRRRMLLPLTNNMAAVTSRANQQLV